MKQIVRKVFLFVVFLFVAFFICKSITVNASSTLTMADGASIRTTGERQGIRFSAQLSEALEEGLEHGFFCALGEHSLEDFTAKIIAGETLINSNKIVNKIIADPDLDFSLVIYNIPSTSYKQDITAIAYVKDAEGNYTFPTTCVTRNIAEVAVASYADYDEVPAIITAAATQEVNYNFNGGEWVSSESFTITNLNTGSSTGNYITIGTKAKYSSTVGLYWDRLFIKATDNSNVYKIIDFKTNGSDSSTTDYDYVIGAHSSCYDTNSKSTVINLTKASSVNDYIYFDTNISSLSTGTINVKAKHFETNDLKYANNVNPMGFVENSTLKSIEKMYYTFNGWYNNPEFNGSTITTIEAGNSGSIINLYAKFTPTNYTINYELNEGTCTASTVNNYTYESTEISLPPNEAMVRSGFTFDGWYDNSIFSGSKITTLPTHSSGNKTFYAKWIANAAITLPVNNDDVRVLNTITPNIIVKTGLTNGSNYKLSNDTLNASYSDLEIKGYSSLAAATTAALANDKIYVFAGTYSDDVTVAVTGISIIGPNYGVDGNATRVNEAKIVASINVKADGLNIDGIKYSGAKQIKILETDNGAKTIVGFKFNHNFSEATGVKTTGGRTAAIAFEGGIVVSSYFEIKNNYFTFANSAGRNPIATYGTITNGNISNNVFNITGVSTSNNWEAYRITLATGTFESNNNTFTGCTANFMTMVTFSSYCTVANFKDNIVQPYSTGTTSGCYFKNLGANRTLNIIGNTFTKVAGSTFDFTGSNSTATINIKYNIFDSNTSHNVSNLGSGIKTYTNNYYATTQTTTTSDYDTYTHDAAGKTACQNDYQAYLAG